MNKKSIVHFIGIGGIGVSALARYFLALGAKISGSDAFSSEITESLKKEGVEVKIGHKTGNITSKIGLIIHSAAIASDNTEIQKARDLGVLIKSYSEVIGGLTKKYKTIAISGSHGKSTTTALLSLVLKNTSFDPTVIIGTKLKEFGNSNFKKGKSDYLVLEADEYQKSFLNYSPVAAIITNIDREHLDVYKNLNEIKKVFLKFIGNIRFGGILVVNKDDKNLFGLRDKIQKIIKKNNLRVFWYSIFPRQSALSRRMSATLKVTGEHNLSNALAVYTLTKVLGINQKKIFNAIGKYRGAWRRMEFRGQLKTKSCKLKADVYDDYAHHPTEIKATLSGVRQKYPKSKIICVFQPHQVKRLKALFKEFTKAFDSADDLILLDIFKVAGRDPSINSGLVPSTSNYSSQKLAEVIEKRKTSPSVFYLKNPKNLPKIIKNILNSKSYILNPVVVVMMGAGDIYKLTDKLIK
ncbi:MAG: UDP-N-acetylmuramate--L-alanine ligase [Patescibacteria group bacterium]